MKSKNLSKFKNVHINLDDRFVGYYNNIRISAVSEIKGEFYYDAQHWDGTIFENTIYANSMEEALVMIIEELDKC